MLAVLQDDVFWLYYNFVLWNWSLIKGGRVIWLKLLDFWTVRFDMTKGIIYIMTTAVPGLIKIGKTGTSNFEQRMYSLEHDGYRNVTALKREFAIEVENYDDKEILLHKIFEKSRVSDTELFALDKNIAIQLLSSFDGVVVFPKTESKQEIFGDAVESTKSKLIPNGIYEIKRKKKSDNKVVYARAIVDNGRWTLMKGSILGITEDIGVSQRAKATRMMLPLDSNGMLLDDVELGECSPSYAGTIVMNQSNNGWTDWKDGKGQAIDIYRQKNDIE